MSVDEAIQRLEGLHKLRGGLSPLFRESAAMLREAKVLIEGACDALDTEGIGEEFIKRAQRWLKE